MRSRPSASELLLGIARTCDADLASRLDGNARRTTVLISSLARTIAREWDLGPAADQAELLALRQLTGESGDLAALRRHLAERLRRSQDEFFDQQAHQLLVEATRQDLAIAKPGYDEWDEG